MDIFNNINLSDAVYYHSLIGYLRWIMEICQVDTMSELSMMTSCMTILRKTHQEQIYHTFEFIKKKHNSMIFFDPSDTEIDEAIFGK